MREKRWALKPGLLAVACVGMLSVFATGCERGVTLQGTVVVPSELQKWATRERPGVVYFEAKIPKTSTIAYTLGRHLRAHRR